MGEPVNPMSMEVMLVVPPHSSASIGSGRNNRSEKSDVSTAWTVPSPEFTAIRFTSALAKSLSTSATSAADRTSRCRMPG